MLIHNTDFHCYQKLQIDNKQDKYQFFLEKHSTREGTWGYLQIEEGEIDFIFLNGEGKRLSQHRINQKNPQILIPPASWHKIIPISADFSASLKFYCKPHRYFNKKYGLGDVHSDLLYIYNTYLQQQQEWIGLDVGCGSGRNLLFLALLGHSITGIDINASSIRQIREIAQAENMQHVQTTIHDLTEPLNLKKEAYNFIFSTVTLQFLQAERIPSLLTELQQATAIQGFHFLVFPIKSAPFSFPHSFTFLADKNELYRFYQDCGWSILEYREAVGKLHQLDEAGKPIQGLFGILFAQKLN